MKLAEIFKDTDINIPYEIAEIDIKGISLNSKEISKDYLFIALKGSKIDGKEFIEEAIEKGAKAVLSDEPMESKIPVIYSVNINRTISQIAKNFYFNPSEKLEMIAITGTKGKTTVSYLLEYALKKLGKKTSVIGTVNYRTYDAIISDSPNTTPEPIFLNQILNKFIEKKCETTIMEVSSHALSLNRVEDISFDSVIFTNIQSDHMDFHINYQNYLSAKMHIFEILLKSNKENKIAIINRDDRSFEEIKKIKNLRYITYGLTNGADYQALELRQEISNTYFNLKYKNEKIPFNLKLIGRHNVYNALAVIAFLKERGFEIEEIKKILEDFSNVPGRLERINSNYGFSVFIDYAHTEESLNSAINALKDLPHKRIITVFGCGGNRDKTKRGPMGVVACSLSDIAIITSDNPRNEPPEEIINQIESAIKHKYENYIKITDREKAIEKAIDLAQKGDLILIAGKGHENYQIIGNNKIHFDDKEIAVDLMRKKGKL
jgi:UDP-N-acetylmuramyl-tripeptide synthetase